MDISTRAGMYAARQWLDNLISLLTDGGSWAIPRADTVYTFHKQDKQFSKIGPGDPDTEMVLDDMGWTPRKTNK